MPRARGLPILIIAMTAMQDLLKEGFWSDITLWDVVVVSCVYILGYRTMSTLISASCSSHNALWNGTAAHTA